jgi:lipopolysaccharide heptosyltransferase I
MEGQRILIVKPSAFGDIVHSLPFLHALRRGRPDALIAWVVARPFVDLLSGHPDVDELAVFERERWGGLRNLPRNLAEMALLARRLRAKRFDTVVDLQGLIRSALLTYLTDAPVRVGFADARELSPLFYTVRVDAPIDALHAVDRNLRVAKALGLPVEDPVQFHVHVGCEAERFAAEFLERANAALKPVVVMLPSSKWETKRWPADCFAKLADRVSGELGAVALFLGGPDDAPLVERIRGMMKQTPLSLAGATTIQQSAALLARAASVVANDSGPMHLAVAVGAPVVALYGPTSPALTGPYGGKARLFKSARDCAPCLTSDCDDPQCMRDITVDEVFEAVSAFINQGRRSRGV